MITVLRIQGAKSDLDTYIGKINSASISAKAHLDRAGRLVADLSCVDDDWEQHANEVECAIRLHREVLIAARNSGNQVIVDVGVYAQTEFEPGISVARNSLRFSVQIARLLAEYSIVLEVTVISVKGDS